jgi:hypothetical protein
VAICVFCKKDIPNNDVVFHTVNCSKGYNVKASKEKHSFRKINGNR